MASRTPVSRRPETVIARILDAAQAEFMAAGFEGASTNRITASFGGSKATLFRHFPTKERLLEGVIRRIASRWRGRIEWSPVATAEPREALVAFANATLDWILDEEALFVGRLGISEGSRFPQLRHVFDELAGAPLRAGLASQLADWTRVGLLASRNPNEDAERFFDLVVAGAVSRALYGVERLGPAAIRKHATSAVDLFLDGLRPR